jgi:hypothetical protein
MVAEVFGGISALKAAFDMTKALADMADSAKRDRLSINLQKEILAAQATQMELIEEVSTLKTQLASFEKWDAETERYKLCQVSPGSLAYVLKKDRAEGEPPHWICAHCYQQRKRQFLQNHGQADKSGPDIRKHLWKCPSCSTGIKVPYSVKLHFAEETETPTDD